MALLQSVAGYHKSFKFCAYQFAAAWQVQLLRVDLVPVAQDFVVQVRTGGPSRGSYIADHLALPDTLSAADAAREAVQMGIGRLVAAIVADADVLAV